jgi:hypothetical protein
MILSWNTHERRPRWRWPLVMRAFTLRARMQTGNPPREEDGVDRDLNLMNDVLPVAHNEAWIAGLTSDGGQKPVLYHYQAGQ